MTSIKLINIYLEGFRACHYFGQDRSSCPYPAGSEAAENWFRGFEYGGKLNDVLTVNTQNLSNAV